MLSKDILNRALGAAWNAALDARQKGWWKGGARDVALPSRGRRGPFWIGFKSVPHTACVDGDYVPLGALAAAAAKAASRASGLRPNDPRVVRAAIWAAAKVGGADLSDFRQADLVFVREAAK